MDPYDEECTLTRRSAPRPAALAELDERRARRSARRAVAQIAAAGRVERLRRPTLVVAAGGLGPGEAA